MRFANPRHYTVFPGRVPVTLPLYLSVTAEGWNTPNTWPDNWVKLQKLSFCFYHLSCVKFSDLFPYFVQVSEHSKSTTTCRFLLYKRPQGGAGELLTIDCGWRSEGASIQSEEKSWRRTELFETFISIIIEWADWYQVTSVCSPSCELGEYEEKEDDGQWWRKFSDFLLKEINSKINREKCSQVKITSGTH